MPEKYEKPSALTVYSTGLHETPTRYVDKKIDGIVATDCSGACKCPSGPCSFCRC